MSKKIVGIIGGVGPAATAELFSKIIQNTEAASDKEHIRILIDNNPNIPDRTAAIINGDFSPVEPIVNAGRGLIGLGADFLAIPCVTAHYFYQTVQSKLDVPLLNIIDETAQSCSRHGYKKVGILATTGTCSTRLFDAGLSKYGIDSVYPNEKDQSLVMHVIYDLVKAGKKVDKNILMQCVEDLKNEGAESIILGCTELPLVFKNGDFETIFIDVLDVLAKTVVNVAGYRVINENEQ